MDGLILENVRCFRRYREVPLAPLTFLVGENSTGKSSLLAATRLAWDIGSGTWEPDFNEPPYEWGAFNQIANYVGGRRGRAHEFSIGYYLRYREQIPNYIDPTGSTISKIWATFQKKRGQPVLSKVQFEHGAMSITISPDRGQNGSSAGEERYQVCLSLPKRNLTTTIEFRPGFPGANRFIWDYILFHFRDRRANADNGLNQDTTTALRRLLIKVTNAKEGRPFASAPIRTRPERTYDPLNSSPKPTGEHVPVVMAQEKAEGPGSWAKLQERLNRFGALCGLFDRIDIKELGKPLASPFQVRVRVLGPAKNLVDVGYGVSQVLPILVESVLGEAGRTYLLQQPEVHLHPKAQAQLGSLLSELAKQEQKRFIVETHGDYIIDRVRREIRQGKAEGVTPEDVLILYFEREGSEIEVHELKIDGRGNVKNAPATYRKFFLEEQRGLLWGD